MPSASSQAGTHLEVLHADDRPSRYMSPSYPAHIQNSGHNGATYFEHRYFLDNIEGKETITATAREGLWSIIVAAAAQESIKRGTLVDINSYLAEVGLDHL